MLRTIALLSLAAVPVAAMAQQVPAIEAQAHARADAMGPGQASASASAGGAQTTNPTLVTATGKPPATGWPPAMSATVAAPAISLDRKEKVAAAMAKTWRDRPDHPTRDAEGVLRWVFGSSQARVVCAPLQMSDIELKAGEVVNNVRVGDTAFWTVTLAISGGPDGRKTHVAISPRDSGRETSMLIYTDQRTYNIKLVATSRDYTPRTGFTYPEDQQQQQDNWASYRVAVAGGALRPGGPAMPNSTIGVGDAAHIEMLVIKGDNPSWRPTAAYTDGRKTYIQFPSEMQFGDSPTLLGVNDDGGLFSAPTDRRVIYRWQGDRLVADVVMDKLALVLGVGSSQQKVMVVRYR